MVMSMAIAKWCGGVVVKMKTGMRTLIGMLIIVGCVQVKAADSDVRVVTDTTGTIPLKGGPADPTYQWLRDDSRQSLAVRHFLEQENRHTEQVLLEQASLEQTLLTEWQARTKQPAEQPWSLQGRFEYRLEAGHAIVRREAGSAQAPQILVDLAQRAATSAYYQLGNWSVSPDHRYVALAEDRRGDRHHRITLLDTHTARMIDTPLQQAATDLVWASDSRSLYWIANERETYRPYRVMRWDLGAKQQQEVYREPDPAWLVSLYRTSDTGLAIIQSNSHNASEQFLLDLTTGHRGTPLRPRQAGMEYYADVRHGRMYLSSNLHGEFALYQRKLESVTLNRNDGDEESAGPTAQDWQLIWQPAVGEEIRNWYLYPQHIVIETAVQQHHDVVLLDYQGRACFRQRITPEGGVAWVSGSKTPHDTKVWIRRMSLSQPAQWLTLDLASVSRPVVPGESALQLRLEAEDHYAGLDPRLYRSEQIVVHHDGVAVPVSLVYRADALTPTSAVVLYGYGAYGTPMRPYFMPQILSLLDRGMVYAIAHVRGGGYLGEEWYRQGRGTLKQNGIDDFRAVAQTLRHYQTGRQRPVLAIGGSAGGTLVAAALNQAPALFRAAVLQVPFLDVVATMSDPALPLTRQEYAEWGNPADPEQRRAMQAYSPLDNIQPQAYPPMLVSAGLYDSQVPYWEAARWVARVRELSLTKAHYLLSTNMQGGHQQDSRKAAGQQAREYAFLIRQAAKAAPHAQ